MSTKYFIACKIVIEEAIPFMPTDMKYHEMDAALHLIPKKLQKTLQQKIDQAPPETEKIILGYGLCSNAVAGLEARKSTLVIPRIDDCIALLLGSKARYLEMQKTHKGTYYLSPGWIEAKVTLVEEFRAMEEKYGKEKTDIIKHSMLKNYTDLAYISMGRNSEASYKQFACQAAKELNLNFREEQGATNLIKKMLLGPWDHDFVVVSPGNKVNMIDFLG